MILQRSQRCNMEWNEFHKSWNPPCGNVPFEVFANPYTVDEKFTRDLGFYTFPWYLKPLWIWYGLRTLITTGKWPERILYFSKERQKDKELYLEIQAELSNDPDRHLRQAKYSASVDCDFDELFQQAGEEDSAPESQV